MLLLVLAYASGCACVWRSGGTERYVGPVFVRSGDPSDSGTVVMQAVHIGFVLEGGSQWGATFGVSERLLASAIGAPEVGSRDQASSVRSMLTLPRSPDSSRWSFSPLYLRLDMKGRARFTRRSLVGTQIMFGDEVRGGSVGYTSRTLFVPPRDAFSLVDFDARRPMQTRVQAWLPDSHQRFPEKVILEEVQK